MPAYRRLRKRESIRITGPAVVTVVSGRAAVTVEAEPQVKIEHVRPKKTQRGLTVKPPNPNAGEAGRS